MKKHKNILIVVVICALVAAGAAMLLLKKRDDDQKKQAAVAQAAQAAQQASTSSVIRDNNGQDVVKTNNPVKATSGLITLYQPAEGAKLSSGQTVSGEAAVPVVSYRIKDDIRGVVAQGMLAVADGKFSGQLTLGATGKTGTLEIYSTDPSTGVEENNVKINVTF